MNALAMQRIVEALAVAKSQQSIKEALNIYHEEAKLITVGLDLEANGRDDVERQLATFFTLFPDYAVEINQVACNSEVLLATGKVSLSLTVGGQSYPTISLPVSFSFSFDGERIKKEEFYLDFGILCHKSGISPDKFRKALEDISL